MPTKIPATVSEIDTDPDSIAAKTLFLKALDAEDLLTNDMIARIEDGVDPEDLDQTPILLAVSDNGPEMRSGETRKLMAACSVAQHFGRPSPPVDEHEGRGEAIREVRRVGLREADQARRSWHRSRRAKQ